MKKNTAPIVAAQATAGENQFWAHADKDGYIVGGMCTRRKPDGLGFLAFLRATRDRYPLEHSAIVMPSGWTLHEDGSATKDVVVSGVTVARLTTELVEVPAVPVVPFTHEAP